MKDDKPKGKSQKNQSEQEVSESDSSSFQKDEEDVDFEILDALEQIEQTGKVRKETPPDDESTLELTLDEEDLDFGEEEVEEEGEFQFDEDIAAGLEDELIGRTEKFSLDESFSEDIGGDVHADIEEESFSIDLDQDNEDESGLSFDEEVSLELTETGMYEGTGETSFDLDEGIGEFDFDSLETKTEDGKPFEAGFDQLEDLAADDTEFDLGADIEGEIEDTSLSDMNDLADFDLESVEQEDSLQSDVLDFGEDISSTSADSFDTEELSHQESLDMGLEDTDEAFGEMDFEDMSDMDESVDFETDIGDTSISDMDVSEMDLENEPDEFSGKSVISVDGDQVIDLGDETEFEQEEEFGTTEKSFDITEEDVDVSLAELEKGAQQVVDHVVSEPTTEQEEDEEFMASLEDIDIDLEDEDEDEDEDLEEETTKILETLESGDEISEFAEEESSEFDLDNFDVTPGEEQEFKTTATEEEIDAQSLAEMFEESEEELDIPEEGISSETEELEIDEAVSEIGEHEELGLTLRLTDSEINQFESMVNEAKTLQTYMQELEEHKTDIKEKIYQKLLKEYISRKINIFRESEFISVRIDVEQDLQDMINKRTEFVSTIERLNDELEEVKVRHMVGEYSDTMLSEQKETQKTEITQWHDKTERIEKFITRYQELLDTEQELNPLESFPEAEQEAASPPEEITQEEEPDVPDEGFSQEMEAAGSLLDNLNADTSDEWEAIEESSEMMAESGLDGEDFALGDELPDIGDELPDIIEESDEEQTAFEDEVVQDETEEEDLINCKKCGRSTPASEKFCVNCGAKAR